MSSKVLEVTQLVTEFETRSGLLRAVDGVSFSVDAGEVLALVGESGSGKSVTGFSLLGLIDPPGRIVSGSVRFKGRELIGMAPRDLRSVRGADIAMVFQDPMTTHNPVIRIGDQLIEGVLAHSDVSRAEAWQKARDALERVGIPAPDERMRAYPHELSGGMRQRVAIAAALLHDPALLIADEATTALDVTIQAQILSELQDLIAERGTAVIWITHDLGVASAIADRIAVMYAGRIVEQSPADRFFAGPRHPYSAGLLASLPEFGRDGAALDPIRGTMPSLANLPAGCAFADRCDDVTDRCFASRPALREVGPGSFACFNPRPPAGPAENAP